MVITFIKQDNFSTKQQQVTLLFLSQRGLVQRTSTHFRPFLTPPPPCPLSIHFRPTPPKKGCPTFKDPPQKKGVLKDFQVHITMKICLIYQGILVFFLFFSMTFCQLQYHTKAKNFMTLLSWICCQVLTVWI